jgi:Ca2+-binding RTX toxin-like protein
MDTSEQEQTLVLAFSGIVGVLGPTFVQLTNAEPTDRLRVNGRRGDDLMSTSTDAMKMTLDGGADTNTLLGGPGDDVLLGGDDFDLIQGHKGDDVVRMGGFFDSFTWNPGDGNDKVDGGPAVTGCSSSAAMTPRRSTSPATAAGCA